MVLQGLGPVAAIPRSGQIVTERSGTQILGGIRIGGMVFVLAMLPALVVFGVVELALAILVSNALRTIVGVALLHWAESGEALGGSPTTISATPSGSSAGRTARHAARRHDRAARSVVSRAARPPRARGPTRR